MRINCDKCTSKNVSLTVRLAITVPVTPTLTLNKINSTYVLIESGHNINCQINNLRR